MTGYRRGGARTVPGLPVDRTGVSVAGQGLGEAGAHFSPLLGEVWPLGIQLQHLGLLGLMASI